jgi:hypothetical protein
MLLYLVVESTSFGFLANESSAAVATFGNAAQQILAARIPGIELDYCGDGLRLLQEHLDHVSFNSTARYRNISATEHRK